MKTITYKPESRTPPRLADATRRRVARASEVWAAMRDIADAPQEHMVVFYLNARHVVIERRITSIGSVAGVEVHPRDVFRRGVELNAVAMILSHNHPSGDPTPSNEDIKLTTRLRECGELMGITVLDHVVVSSEGFISLADQGWL